MKREALEEIVSIALRNRQSRTGRDYSPIHKDAVDAMSRAQGKEAMVDAWFRFINDYERSLAITKP